jgi:hypothetical protein
MEEKRTLVSSKLREIKTYQYFLINRGKGNLNISDYKLITLDFPVIGNPQPHTGNPEEYRSQMHSYTNEVNY